jgi:predicted nucleic acid-binding protein
VRERLFVDRFYFIAVVNERDQYHEAVLHASAEVADSLFWTTEWMLLEFADACSDHSLLRGHAAQWIRSILAGEMTVVHTTPELFQKALSFYERHADKHWSLADCLSFIVMRDNGITKALTGDHHFVQAGFDALLR